MFNPASNPVGNKRRAALLLAKAAITGASDSEMQVLSDQLMAAGLVETVRYAYSEQGTPTLREALQALADDEFAEVVLLPLLLPMEPGFRLWIARTVQRWRDAEPERSWPLVRIACAPAQLDATPAWLGSWLAANLDATPAEAPPRTPEGSVVPPQQRRVLVCHGAPCNDAGAAAVWSHLRNEQKRLSLRTEGVGVMSCKTTCLGPCGLAPVLQVFPDGTYYGGVDEAGVDRIIAQHLIGGEVATDLAYPALPGRQRLRVQVQSEP